MNKAIKPSPLTSEPLESLFLAMSMKHDNDIEAKKAFKEFYDRYKNYLYTIIKKACSSWEMYGTELIQDVFNNTFLIVYEKAESFIFIENIDRELQDKRMKAWLGQIAKNELLQLLRRHKDEKDRMNYTDDLSSISSTEEDDENKNKTELSIVEKALSSLSERDKHILMTYMMFEDGNKKLPSEQIQILSDLWKVHPDNLRQIKKRSLAKVKLYIETVNNNNNNGK